MTNNVNAIGVNGNLHLPTKKQEKKEDLVKEDAVQNNTSAKTHMNPEDVLSFMAQASALNKPQARNYDVSKYVTPEQATRIAGFINGFESEVSKGLKVFDAAFGKNTLGDEQKLDLIVQVFNNKNLS